MSRHDCGYVHGRDTFSLRSPTLAVLNDELAAFLGVTGDAGETQH